MSSIWVLLIIIVLHGDGKPAPQFALNAFESQAQCEAAKSVVMKQLAAKYPDSPESLTCFEPSPLGKPT